jgi:hypothetical protein
MSWSWLPQSEGEYPMQRLVRKLAEVVTALEAFEPDEKEMLTELVEADLEHLRETLVNAAVMRKEENQEIADAISKLLSE